MESRKGGGVVLRKEVGNEIIRRKTEGSFPWEEDPSGLLPFVLFPHTPHRGMESLMESWLSKSLR